MDLLRQRFVDEVRIGSLVLVKCAVDDQEGQIAAVARVVKSEEKGVISVHWYGNRSGNLNRPLEPMWTVHFPPRSPVRQKAAYGKKPTKREHPKMTKSVAYTQLIDPGTVLYGPLELAKQKILKIAQRKMLQQRDDIEYTFEGQKRKRQ